VRWRNSADRATTYGGGTDSGDVVDIFESHDDGQGWDLHLEKASANAKYHIRISVRYKLICLEAPESFNFLL
jgi:hypothetical protein